MTASTTHLSPALKQATPVVVDHAIGSWIHGTDGNRYLDFTTGIGVTSTGHCHPRVVEAAREQVGKIIHAQYTTVMHKPLLELTEKLGDVLPAGLDSVFYANSGSEAVEASIRLARMATGRPNIIAFHGGFHGRTVAAASLTTAGTKFRSGFSPIMGGVHIAPFPYAFRYGWDVDTAVAFALKELDYLLATVSSPADTAAFIIEPVLGDGGYIQTPPAFLEGLRERADRHGIVFVVDEVQAGVGRTGKFWGHEHSAAKPDIVITAKGLASGFPISAIAASTELMSKAWPGSQGGTYGGNAVAAAAAIATLDVVRDEGLVENAAKQGAALLDGLRGLKEQYSAIGDARGVGLMLALEFVDDAGAPDAAAATRVQQTAISEGLLLLTCGGMGNVVRVIPALVVTDDEIAEGVDALARTLKRAL
ncbi:aminotransferase class III-fold pyridoxal phosphate-dependent enzyme [Rhodococcus sp. BP-252]|uniref:aspartate aminotransferase family protein n=1 Tax=unclassified Rhodococcus (in: high G+C Gram-positive bacteria) TaxID=192944 RepID=UPI001C9B08C6|nr:MULTISPECIES: aminotransferase class III-fold pyridoxal phosphate-dependent enzyme [unclassified Rhodococcus (in: high G+C Gram-positive bacteria)]MBY6412076.1 aminotransferase class III-fold pyridoxal phosphate-dependent enzyme [Rhodococcus sp. BP-320]MBY6416656.1 aminotransferase class III-fold pyridoxal phosphate-dependent enzyme [Rhodococcus sp. BP-321]MBY6421155.1 aminotransferase class III-fold pyridoxal phosphate-dependent enzyme [Rhodococcus sp. BP-324]MBY6426680.1 aminotransferase c